MLGISSSNLNDGLRSNHVLLARPQTQRRKKQQAGPFFISYYIRFCPTLQNASLLVIGADGGMRGGGGEGRAHANRGKGGDSVKRLKYFCFFRAQFIVTVHIESL